MTTCFVTSSGTGIGKTHVCCRLLATLPAALTRRCLKPVISGFDAANAADSDTARLLAAQGLALDDATIAATSPWRFRAPLSPDMAAAREGRAIPYDELVAFSRAPPGVELNLIEGVGGVMAPLDEQHTVLDWIAALDATTVLVVGSYLGTLSHTLTALAVLQQRAVDVLAIVISQSAEEPVPMDETRASLKHLAPDVPVLVMPRDPAGDAAELAALVTKKCRRLPE